jgi:hypothetical protein
MTLQEAQRIIEVALFLTANDRISVLDSKQAFQSFVGEIIKQCVPGASVDILGSDRIRVKVAGSEAVKTFQINRTYTLVQTGQITLPKLAQRLEGLFSARTKIGNDLNDNPNIVVPLIKSSIYAQGNAVHVRDDAVKAGLDAGMAAKVSWSVTAGMEVFPVLNLPDQFSFISNQHCVDAGMSPEEVRALAMDNLAQAYDAYGSPGDYSGGSKELTGMDGFTSALVLLDEFLQFEAQQAGSDLFIFSGNAGHLYLVPETNLEFAQFVFARISSGRLPTEGMPPLFYQGGRLHELMAEDFYDPSRKTGPRG